MRNIIVEEITAIAANGKKTTKPMKSVIFPLGIGELLDERLDEATITVFNDKTEKYEPLTEIKITIYEGEASKEYYFIVASDEATRVFPQPWKTRTKHELYLVERTKLLEGVVCPSLTFTNVLNKDLLYASNAPLYRAHLHNGPDYSPNAKPPYASQLEMVQATMGRFPTFIRDGYTFPTPAEILGWSGKNSTLVLNTEVYVSTGVWEPVYNRIEVRLRGTQDVVTAIDFTEDLNEAWTPSLENGNYDVVYRVIYRYKEEARIFVEYLYYATEKTSAPPPPDFWTITNCVERVLTCAEPLAEEAASSKYPLFYARRFNFNPRQAEKYRNIVAPELTLSEGTLREQLKTIGNLIHGEPYLDENNEISFLDLGLEKKANINGKDVFLKRNWDVNEYCTSVRTFAQNIITPEKYSGGTTIEPSNGYFKSLRTEELYARVTELNCAFITSKPIYQVNGLYIGVRDENSEGGWKVEPDKNLVSFLYEESLYQTLSSFMETTSANPDEIKGLALHFARGKNYIKGMTFLPEQLDDTSAAIWSQYAITNILQRSHPELDLLGLQAYLRTNINSLVCIIEYLPVDSVLVEHHKNETAKFSTIYPNRKKFNIFSNQQNGYVDTASFGEKIKGEVARIGNPEYQQTFILNSVFDIPKVGQLYNGYAISGIFSEIMPQNIKCTVSLTKDFNRISQYVGIPQEKRLYEVSESNVTDRKILIHNTLVITEDTYGTNGLITGQPLVFTKTAKEAILAMFASTWSNDGTDNAKAFSKTGVISWAFAHAPNALNKVALPVSISAVGNSLVARFEYSDNYSAGPRTSYQGSTFGIISGYFQQDVRYTDAFGRVKTLIYHLMDDLRRMEGVELRTDPPFIVPDISADDFAYSMPRLNVPAVAQEYPKDLGYAIYRVLKDNRERLVISSSLEARTTVSGLIIGSALMRCNSMHNHSPLKYSDVGIVLIYNEDFLPSKFETKFQFHANEDLESTIVDNFDYTLWRGAEGTEYFKVFGGKKATNPSWIEGTLEAPRDAVGWAIIKNPQMIEQKVIDDDGNVITKIENNGSDILLSRVIDIKAGDIIIPELHFTITNE